MSTLTIASPAQAAGQGYLKNVARAALGLLCALLAVTPEARAPKASPRDRLVLYRLANQYESLMPNLAGELRFIAGRD